MTGAQAMVKALEAEGVTIVYGYPGAAICPFFDAVSFSDKLNFVLVRQEQNAGHAASGYARVTGRPGVCTATSGPGATNLITALATAYMDSIPIVAITGQVRSDLIGRDVFQEADITGAAEPFCKYSFLVKEAALLPQIMREAFYIAASGRPGPVLIDVPIDIQQTDIGPFKYPEKFGIKGYKPSFKGHALQIKRVAEAISKTKKPVICAGGGVISAGAEKELVELSEKCGIPVVTTMMGIGAVPSSYPLYLGMLGTFGKKAANAAIHEAELLIIAGARVGDRAVAKPDQIAARATVVHIDIDPAEIGKNIETEIPIVGDVKSILAELCRQAEPAGTAEWTDYIRSLKKTAEQATPPDNGFIEPRRFIRLLSAAMEDNAAFVADVGQNQIWSANNFEIKNNRFLTSGGMGTMGYGVPAAVGACAAFPDRQTVVVCGDGSFQMAQMELATIAQQGLKVKIVVMKNDRLGMVRELQEKLYGSRFTATVLNGDPDFIALAAAYGIRGRAVDKNSEVGGAVREMLSFDGPFLLECSIDPAEASM